MDDAIGRPVGDLTQRVDTGVDMERQANRPQSLHLGPQQQIAAGRDFHNFNIVYRGDPAAVVLAFTAAQIPGISGRRYTRRRLRARSIPRVSRSSTGSSSMRSVAISG